MFIYLAFGLSLLLSLVKLQPCRKTCQWPVVRPQGPIPVRKWDMFDWICAGAFEYSLNPLTLDTNRKFFWGPPSPHMDLAASFDEKKCS